MNSVFVSSNEALNSTSEVEKEQEESLAQSFEEEHGGRYTYDQIEFWIYTGIATCSPNLTFLK